MQGTFISKKAGNAAPQQRIMPKVYGVMHQKCMVPCI